MSASGIQFDFAAMQAQGQRACIPELFVLIMTPLPPALDAADPTMPGEASPLEAHYAYIHRLVKQGKMLVIGPCMREPTAESQAPVPPGIGILRVKSRTEAEEIAQHEPFHAIGWRHNTVMAWTPKFGALVELLSNATCADG